MTSPFIRMHSRRMLVATAWLCSCKRPDIHRVETPLAAAHDAASRTFWRNVAARSAHEQVLQACSGSRVWHAPSAV